MDEESVFRRPWVKVTLNALGALLVYGILYWLTAVEGGIQKNLPYLRWDMVICLGGLLFWSWFFSQFILPVDKFRGRLAIFERLIRYFLDQVLKRPLARQGAALFVENGCIRGRESELDKHGKGVIWLDSASAALLRTATAYTRVVGPGVHFTKKGEYIAAAVDLHQLMQVVGPRAADKPFDPPPEGEVSEEYKKAQERRYETSVTTRDGIEIVAEIAVNFRVDDARRAGSSEFLFDPAAVEKYITHNIQFATSPNEPLWSRFPAQMAVDVWREYVRKYKLDELFQIPEASQGFPKGKTVLQYIAGLVKDRLTKAEVEELDHFGKPNGSTQQSREYALLSERGIKVASVSIRRLIFSQEIEDRLNTQWTAVWLENAQRERQLLLERENQSHELGQKEAHCQAVTTLSDQLKRYTWAGVYGRPTALPGIREEMVNLLLTDTIRLINHDRELNARMEMEKSQLREIAKHLRTGGEQDQ